MKKYLLIFLLQPIFSGFGQVTKTIELEGSSNNYDFEISPDNYTIEAIYDDTQKYNFSFAFSKNPIPPLSLDNTAEAKIRKALAPVPLITPIIIFQRRFFRGDKLVITVTKTADPNYKKEFIFEVPPTGTWKASFGATFIQPWFNQEHSYYIEQNASTNDFTIRKADNPNKVYFVPTVFYHFVPFEKEDSKWSKSLTGGIGIQTNNASASFFLGGSLMYNQNLAIQVGVSYHQLNVLKSQYSDGQVIKQNLTSDDITQKAYRFNPFISMSLRFDKNPIK